MFCHVQICTLNVHINISFCMVFRHVHVCTNDYPYSYGFLSCTCLHEWLSIFLWVFVMYMFVRMTIHIIMSFCHVHVCTNDYPYSYGFSSCTCLYEWLPFLIKWIVVIYISVQMTTISFSMDCRHLHFCKNDYHFFLNGLASFTFLYEWLPFLFEWIVVIYISVRMTTIYFWMDCRHLHFCLNDYHFVVYGFRHAHSVQMTFHILCIWIFDMHISVRMTFHILLVFTCVQCSSTRE